jgi:transcriptional regulator with XRE-family HTH domain
MLATTYRTLAEFLHDEQARRGLTSSYELAELLGVAQGTAYRLTREHRVPRETTLAKIARALDVPITEVRELAHRPPGAPERFAWPPEFNQLSTRQRDVLYEIGFTFLAAGAGAGRNGRSQVAELPHRSE